MPAILKFHACSGKEAQKHIEKLARECLKADDEEAYMKLIDTRITHLLRQMDSYLDSLAQTLRAQVCARDFVRSGLAQNSLHGQASHLG